MLPLLRPTAPPDADVFRGGRAGPPVPVDVNGEGDEEGEALGPATVVVDKKADPVDVLGGGRFGNGGVGR